MLCRPLFISHSLSSACIVGSGLSPLHQLDTLSIKLETRRDAAPAHYLCYFAASTASRRPPSYSDDWSRFSQHAAPVSMASSRQRSASKSHVYVTYIGVFFSCKVCSALFYYRWCTEGRNGKIYHAIRFFFIIITTESFTTKLLQLQFLWYLVVFILVLVEFAFLLGAI